MKIFRNTRQIFRGPSSQRFIRENLEDTKDTHDIQSWPHHAFHHAILQICLVVWNMTFIYFPLLSIYWEIHNPNCYSYLFQRGRSTTKQICFSCFHVIIPGYSRYSSLSHSEAQRAPFGSWIFVGGPNWQLQWGPVSVCLCSKKYGPGR